jgi:hypothetical protein
MQLFLFDCGSNARCGSCLDFRTLGIAKGRARGLGLDKLIVRDFDQRGVANA